jgi:thioredoxin-related protein
MTKAPIYLLLVFLLSLIFFRHLAEPKKDNNTPKPDKVVVIEPDVVPVLKSNVVYDLPTAEKLAKQYKRNIILIFSADWCDYCKELKKVIDNKSIKNLQDYIICLINIEKNQDLVKQYEVKRLPTSILLNDTLKEWSRKVGYQTEEYELWLKNL